MRCSLCLSPTIFFWQSVILCHSMLPLAASAACRNYFEKWMAGPWRMDQRYHDCYGVNGDEIYHWGDLGAWNSIETIPPHCYISASIASVFANSLDHNHPARLPHDWDKLFFARLAQVVFDLVVYSNWVVEDLEFHFRPALICAKSELLLHSGCFLGISCGDRQTLLHLVSQIYATDFTTLEV